MKELSIDIFIITYNRADKLKSTLVSLANSIFRDHVITVVDNCSTDRTKLVVEELQNFIPNLGITTNKVNIGPNANFLRAVELSESNYIWVLCDDDSIALSDSDFTDVAEVIKRGVIDLIHVGAHPQRQWSFSGIHKPRELLEQGYPYFKFCSFMPCNIFKTQAFTKYFMIQSYNNISNSYPHMPFLFSVFTEDKDIYVSKRQIMTASTSGQGYTKTEWYYWWMRTCELLINPLEVRSAFLDQWKDIGEYSERSGLDAFYDFKQNEKNYYIDYFINKYFTVQDKIYYRERDRNIIMQKINYKLNYANNMIKRGVIKLVGR